MNAILKKIYTLPNHEQLKIAESILSSMNGSCAFPHMAHKLSAKKQVEYKDYSLDKLRMLKPISMDQFFKQVDAVCAK